MQSGNHKKEKPFYQTVPSAPPVPSKAAAHAAIERAERSKTVAARVPKLRIFAALLIGLQVLAIGTALLLQGMWNSESSLFEDPLYLLSIIAGVGTAVLLLVSKSPRLVKLLLLGLGIFIVFMFVRDVLTMAITLTGTAIDVLVLWWIYQLYGDVDALS